MTFKVGETVKVKISGHTSEIDDMRFSKGRDYQYHLKGYGIDAWFNLDDLEVATVAPPGYSFDMGNGLFTNVFTGKRVEPSSEFHRQWWPHRFLFPICNREVDPLSQLAALIGGTEPSRWQDANRDASSADIAAALASHGLETTRPLMPKTPEQWRDHALEIVNAYERASITALKLMLTETEKTIEDMKRDGIPEFIINAITAAVVARLDEVAADIEEAANG